METITYNTIPVDFDPFAQGELAKTVQLTDSQQEIWMACLIGGIEANCAYNESISLVLRGVFERDALSRALQELLNRHEALRSTFSTNGEYLCIQAESRITAYYEDLSSLDALARNSALETYGINDVETPFDLQNGPLFRAAIFKLAEDEHHVRLTAHHLVCDGWSFGIILEDLAALYSAYAQHQHPQIEAPTGFGEYADYLKEFSKSDACRKTEAFWSKQYERPYTQFEIPIDFPRPSNRTYKSDRADFALDNNLVEDLKSTGKSYGSSLVTVLLTAFEAYLYRLSSQEDIVVGLAAAGQSASGYNNLVGHCVNLLPVRSTPNGDLSYGEYLRSRKGEIMDAYDHQQLTLGKLLKSIKINRDGAQVPLTPIVFNVDISMGEQVSFHGLKHELIFNPRRYENFEIFLNITRSQGSFVLEWSYNTQLFTADTINRMMAEFECLLRSITQSPEQQIAKLDILPNVQLAQLDLWNETMRDMGNEQTFIALFDKTAQQYPDRVAVTFKDRHLTFSELETQSNRFAHALIESGVEKGNKIGVVLDRSEQLIVALIGIMKTGAIYLPFDVNLPTTRVSGILEEVEADFLLTSEAYHGQYTHKGKEIHIEQLLNRLGQLSADKPAVSIDGDDLIYILHTSGSTGKPKGVQIMHKNIANFLKSMQVCPSISDRDKVLAITPISFDMAVVLYLPLVTGSELVLADVETSKDGRMLHEMLIEKKISWMIATPSTWEMIISSGWDQPLALLGISAGEALNPRLAKQLLERCYSVWNGYGPTETTVMILMKQIISHEKPITLGKPLANTKIYLLDRYGNRVPIGHHGEIHIAGANIGAGYYNRPDLTERAFVTNSFSNDTDEKMYRTGDLGRYTADGDIQYLGRIDNQVKIRGHRIELGEIEHTLIKQRGIKDAVTLALEDHKGDKELVAYVVPDSQYAMGWQERWDDLYQLGVKSEEHVPLAEQNLDIAIVTQNYSSDTLIEEKTEWTLDGVKRIEALGAKRIIELGTGGGHLLFELAPNADEYVATDFSAVAIDKLNEKLTLNPQKWEHVNAYVAPADDFSSIASNRYDLVILHSVAQYFPSQQYLIKVIENAIRSLTDGGCIYIGDMQTIGAVSMYFYYDQLQIVDEEITIAEYQRIIDYRIKKEEELSLDPSFFYSLPSILPEVKSVDIQLRGGEYLNEMTKCHYDIWLYVGDAAPEVAKPEIELQWTAASGNDWLHQQLTSFAGKTIVLKDIPNQRVRQDYELLKLINTSDPNDKIRELKKRFAETSHQGVNPTELWNIGEKLGFKTHVRWPKDGSDGLIEAFFIPSSMTNVVPDKPSAFANSTFEQPAVNHKANENIEILDIPVHQLKIWKNGLGEVLPNYMVPNRWIAISEMPTNTNGKIDKQLLSGFHTAGSKRNEYVGPSNETQKTLTAMWTKLLALDKISVNDSFFDIGGHSIIAIKMMVAIQEHFGIKLPLAALFEYETIAQLADLIDKKKDPLQWDCVIPIRAEGSKPPLYVIHGLLLDILFVRNLLPYLDSEQPLYGIQGMGLSGKSKPLHTVEEIAKHYVDEILQHTPNGPYAITGYSSGGIYALEVARLLESMGKEVLFVGLLDTYSTNPQFPTVTSWLKFYLHFGRISVQGNSLISKVTMTLSYFAFRIASDFLARFSYTLYSALINKKNRWSRLQVNNHLAIEKFRLKNFQLKTDICLFKSPWIASMAYFPDYEHNGWTRHLNQELIIIPIKENHDEMFTFDQGLDLATKLQNKLNEAWEKHHERLIVRNK